MQALTALTAALNASDVVLQEGTATVLVAGMSSLVDVSITAIDATAAAAPAAGATVVDPVIAAAAPLLAQVLEHVTLVGEYIVYNLPQTSTDLISIISSNLAEFEAAGGGGGGGGGARPTGDAAATYEATVAQVQAATTSLAAKMLACLEAEADVRGATISIFGSAVVGSVVDVRGTGLSLRPG